MTTPPRRSDAASIISNARTFFVTSSTWDKRNLLQSDRSAGLFLKVIYEYRAQGKFKLHEFVIMPDHFHLLLTVAGDMAVERAVQFIKGGLAFRAGKEFGIKAPFWQKGFSEVRVFDAQRYAQIRGYIRNNPVKRGLAMRPEEYLYSSRGLSLSLIRRHRGLSPFNLAVGTIWLKPYPDTNRVSRAMRPDSHRASLRFRARLQTRGIHQNLTHPPEARPTYTAQVFVSGRVFRQDYSLDSG